ncbi:MAG: GH3 auxin-responsive promoter family protein, partial [Treponema sp.]|nr:GH3 auxin-responsive promoter family protein [Treponema sp.]
MKEQRVKGWWLIRLALTIIGRKGLAELAKAAKDAKSSQEAVLRSFLERAKDTVYGREHHFEVILGAVGGDNLFELYRQNVGINDYEKLRPYIERHKNGEPDILFPGKPKMYATTSGTTREPKWIPITEQYYQEVYKKSNQLWFYTMIQSRPKVFYGKTLSIVGKAIEGAAPDGTVYGSISGISQRDIPRFMNVLHPAPNIVFHIADYKARYYAIMRMGIEQDCTLILTANPSTLVEMQTNANEFYDEYVNDIENGTLSGRLSIPEGIRSVLEA